MKNWKKKVKEYFWIIGMFMPLFGFSFLIYAATIYILKNISLEISRNILEYLRVLAWPTISLILVAVFKSNLAQLIERLEEGENPFIGKWKAGISQSKQLSLQEDKVSSTEVSVVSDANFEKIVAEKEVEIVSLKDNGQQLLNKLTVAEVELDFERIYNAIFSSQIELLAKLNVSSPSDFQYIESHYANVQRKYRKIFKEWGIGQYVQFLLNAHLIEFDSSSATISITLKGRAFLSYLIKMNYKKYGI